MKTKIYIFLAILVTVSFISCSVQNKVDIESIKVLFYNYSFESILPVNCDDMKTNIPSMDSIAVMDEKGDSTGVWVENHGILDTIITNPLVIRDIATELKNLKPDSVNYSIDARISCTIKYKDGKEEKICIGGYLAEDIEYRGMHQKQNKKLLYLIKKHIGYYSWMDDRILKYSEELQDNSFIRDSITGYSGRKF